MMAFTHLPPRPPPPFETTRSPHGMVDTRAAAGALVQVANSELARERAAKEEASARASKAEREVDQARARAAVVENKLTVGLSYHSVSSPLLLSLSSPRLPFVLGCGWLAPTGVSCMRARACVLQFYYSVAYKFVFRKQAIGLLCAFLLGPVRRLALNLRIFF